MCIRDRANAKQEILELIGIIIPEETKTPLEASPHIKCATIECDSGKTINLKVDWTDEEFKTFLDQMDFEYDNGYGTQELFGTLWLTDGTWLERAEYDGSEWWSHKFVPKIPNYLIKI
jgi:hypothetical protein